MADAMIVEWIGEKYEALRGTFNERTRRLWAAAEARSLGYGGTAAVIVATGMSSATVYKGIAELAEAQRGGEVLSPKRIRQPGAGRKRATDKQPGLARALGRLVEPTARGRSGVRVALDLQEYAEAGGGTEAAGFRGGAAYGGPRTEGAGFQSPVQP